MRIGIKDKRNTDKRGIVDSARKLFFIMPHRQYYIWRLKYGNFLEKATRKFDYV